MSVNVTSSYMQDLLAKALMSTDPRARQHWAPQFAGFGGNPLTEKLYDTAKQYGLQSPEYQATLQQVQAQFNAGPGGLAGILNKAAVPTMIGIGGLVGGAALGIGPLAASGAGSAATAGGSSLPPANGVPVGGGSSGGGLGSLLGSGSGISKYLPTVLTGAGILSGASQQGHASSLENEALGQLRSDYASRAPLRSAGSAALAALPDAHALEATFANPSNPFFRGTAVNQVAPLPQPSLSVGPNGLPLPRRGL